MIYSLPYRNGYGGLKGPPEAEMQTKVECNKISASLWTARIIPIILAGIVGYATYVLVAILSVNYLLRKRHDHGAAIPILVVYFILFILMTTSFLRLVHITIFDPPYVPLPPPTPPYAGPNEPNSSSYWAAQTKDVFTCSMDGRPSWCNTCGNWKPDRAHHCSSSGRCIFKMDHFCPWVGGPIGENNFKFFIQFTGYTALYCIHLLVVMAIYIHQQKVTEGESVNPQFAVILGLAAFFGLFTGSMFSTGIGMAMTNLTQVEKLGHKTKVHTLAVLKPLPEELLRTGQYTVSQFPYPEIIYPLEIGYALRADSCEVLPQTNTDKPLPDTKRTAALQQSQTLQEKSTHPMPGLSPGPGDDSSVSVRSPGHLGERSKKTVVAPTGDNVEQAALSRVSSELRQRKEFEIEASRRPRKALSASELKAVRLFAILRLNPGDNPWDLGSYLLNFETVMGENVFDWFLPFRRSPCCNHEDPESYYRIGPVVKLARAKAFSMDAKDPGAKVNPKMSERYQNDAEAGCPGREPTEGHSLLSNHEHAISPNAQIEMNNLSGYPPQQQPG